MFLPSRRLFVYPETKKTSKFVARLGGDASHTSWEVKSAWHVNQWQLSDFVFQKTIKTTNRNRGHFFYFFFVREISLWGERILFLWESHIWVTWTLPFARLHISLVKSIFFFFIIFFLDKTHIYCPFHCRLCFLVLWAKTMKKFSKRDTVRHHYLHSMRPACILKGFPDSPRLGFVQTFTRISLAIPLAWYLRAKTVAAWRKTNLKN